MLRHAPAVVEKEPHMQAFRTFSLRIALACALAPVLLATVGPATRSGFSWG
ncbi:protein of unknown function [Streptomyces sp. KY75]|nr:protein of unknown function [Streptomyces sp. KY70]CAD5986032.1 protein of unknown function [Streptomyces sp. KY75]